MDRAPTETLEERELRDLTEPFKTRFFRVLPVIIYSVVAIIALSYPLIVKKTGPLPTLFATFVLAAFIVPLLWIVEAQEKPNALTACLLTGMGICVTGVFASAARRISQ